MEMSKKQSLIFTSIMCFIMVLFMSSYNIILYHGYDDKFFLYLIIGFLPGYICAFLCDILIVARPAKKLAFKLLKHDGKLIIKILTISFFMVCGMVLCMSIFGTIINLGFTKEAFSAYGKAVVLNFIMALPLQLLIAGPATRTISGFIFRKFAI